MARSSSRPRVADLDHEHEAVELGFGQGIGAFLLDGVLRGQDEEGRLEREGLAAGGDLVFLHGLEEGGLGLGRRAVDLVGEEHVGEDGALDEREDAALPVSGSSWMTSVPVMSEGMRSGVNWMRLNLRLRTRARVEIMRVLARPGTPDEQAVAAGEHGDQEVVDDIGLADDDFADFAKKHLAGVLDLLHSGDFTRGGGRRRRCSGGRRGRRGRGDAHAGTSSKGSRGSAVRRDLR